MFKVVSRRSFIGATLLTLSPFGRLFHKETRSSIYINGHIDSSGQHYVSGFDDEGHEQFRQQLKNKSHGYAVNPIKPWQVVCLPTLPGTCVQVLDAQKGEIIGEINSQKGDHFFGHGCFSLDGKQLYVSENHVATAEGVIGVYNASNLKRIGELPGYGIGPHDIRMLPDDSTLVIASGGIETHPSSGKRELNINSMESALIYIDRFTGRQVNQFLIPTPRLSIRHLDVGHDGTILIACQYKGRTEMPALVGVQQGDKEIEMLTVPDDILWTLQNYTASARITARGIGVVSCPRGNMLALWDLKSKQFIATLPIKDVGGIECDKSGNKILASANTGELYQVDLYSRRLHQMQNTAWHDAKWTNHMTRTDF